MTKCGCPSIYSWSAKRCCCSSANVACNIICKCCGSPDKCHNKETCLALAEEELLTERDKNEAGDRNDDEQRINLITQWTHGAN